MSDARGRRRESDSSQGGQGDWGGHGLFMWAMGTSGDEQRKVVVEELAATGAGWGGDWWLGGGTAACLLSGSSVGCIHQKW